MAPSAMSLEEPPDLAGDVALDAAGDLAVGLAFGSSPSPVGDGVGVAARAGYGDDVERMDSVGDRRIG